MKIEEMIKVMEHFKNGGEVEYRVKDDVYTSWSDCPKPIWDWFELEYRIKESKSKITIEKWLCRDKEGDYVVIEASFVDKYKLYEYEKIKLLETYDVEL